ncbi:general stress protein [Massilia sp. G4R7]|uniref:General stress protein n=1 Tax=Massilia phyllostachyos TaxID=2898585 RepID=A0ABS8Q773_9BURK|nr:general stress protein [Massilia phyllostachyos]MCD2516811.1 general stress protein [Massilia phyllostachyos]
MQHTLVAVFDNRTDAQNAMNELLSSGFSRNEVKLSNADPTGMTDSVTGRSDTSASSTDTYADGTGVGIGESIKNFFSDLFGADNSEHASRYEGAVTRGHHVVTVRADSLPEVERAADIVERYGPTDIDEQASGAGLGGLGATGGLSESMRASAAGGLQQSSQMSAQSGLSGNLGSSSASASGSATGSNIGSTIGSTSSAASQQLDNPGDRNIFQQQSLNQAEPMGTTYQEPQGQSGLSATGGTNLQGSTLQENSVQSSSLEGTQNDRNIGSSGGQAGTLQGSSLEGSAYQGGATGSLQRDTTSSSFNEVQRGRSRIYSRTGEGAAGGSGLQVGSNFFGDDDDAYRNHFLANYTGEDYDTVKPAYAYGAESARSDKYRGRKWDDVENDLHSDWTSRNGGIANSAGDTWDKMKAAVRRGWDKMTSDDDDTIYRSHFSSTYGTSGASYDDYQPAYSYGAESARSDKYRGRKWDDVETDLSSDWSTRYGSTGSTWDKMKAAVRRGWDRMTLDDDNYYRSHYDTHLASSGVDYDSVKPAYSYGSEMRRSEMFRNRPWDDIEGDLRKGWDSRVEGGGTYAGSTPATTSASTTGSVGGAWDKMKAAVRHGWDKMTDDDDNDAAYRSHWNATYSTATDGSTYDEYKPAYSYGSEMARNEKYRGRQWNDVENDLRTDWDSRYANGGQSTWEKMKAAVRQGWDRMTA